LVRPLVPLPAVVGGVRGNVVGTDVVFDVVGAVVAGAVDGGVVGGGADGIVSLVEVDGSTVVVVVAGLAAWVDFVLWVAAATTSATSTANMTTNRAISSGRRGVIRGVEGAPGVSPLKLQQCHSPQVSS
jgi:hypothetical protein